MPPKEAETAGHGHEDQVGDPEHCFGGSGGVRHFSTLLESLGRGAEDRDRMTRFVTCFEIGSLLSVQCGCSESPPATGPQGAPHAPTIRAPARDLCISPSAGGVSGHPISANEEGTRTPGPTGAPERRWESRYCKTFPGYVGVCVAGGLPGHPPPTPTPGSSQLGGLYSGAWGGGVSRSRGTLGKKLDLKLESWFGVICDFRVVRHLLLHVSLR